MVSSATKKKQPARAGTRHVDLPETIAGKVRELITRGTFQPGLQLRQMELAERFDSSRVPLREALKLLCAEGIIHHDPNRGFFVAPLSLDEARQLFRIRHLLEAELLGTVRWPSEQQLAALRKRLRALETSLKRQDRDGWLTNHREFHEAIFNLSDQKVLTAEVLRLIRLTDRYRALAAEVLPDAERKATQEKHLLEALAKKNRKKLLKLFEIDRTRIEQGLESVLKARGL